MEKRVKITSGIQLKKCSTRGYTSEDQISQLPDDILVHIISFLKLKEAAQTSVLSTRWSTLWTFSRCLDFDATKSLDKVELRYDDRKFLKRERRKYTRWVRRILQFHKGSTLDEFRISFDLDSFSQKDIDTWLEYAFTRKVKRLELDLMLWGDAARYGKRSYNFPDRLLNPSNGLSTMLPHSNHPGTHLHKTVHFKSLRELCLKSVEVTGEVIEFFLYNCPFLERLAVVDSTKLVNLVVSGPSLMLKHLQIESCKEAQLIRICNNNLISLRVELVKNIRLFNVPMLSEISVFWDVHNGQHFAQLSSCLPQLEVLVLRHLSPEGIINVLDFPELSQLKELVIETGAWNDDSMMGFTSLITACPLLHKFVLQFVWMQRLKIINREHEKGTKCIHKYLKEIELVGYCGRTSDAELLMYFLENAVALEKIIVHPQTHNRFRFFRKMTRSQRSDISRGLQQLEQLVPPNVELVIL